MKRLKNKKFFTEICIYAKILKCWECHGGRMMAKLKLKESCYKGVGDVVAKEIRRTSAHKTLVKEANEQIERNRIRYATAYNKAGSYLNN